MEHPTYEELLTHLESSAGESAKRIKQHLENCAECSAEIAGWQRTIQQLQNYDLPATQKVPVVGAARPGGLLKWAAAAIFILSIGIALGRYSQPSAARLKENIVAGLKPQLHQELKAEFLAALRTPEAMPTNSFQQQLRRELVSTLTASEQQRLLQQVLQVVQQKQNENQRAMVTLLNQVRSEHQADYLSLRHDLETAAYVADNDLKQNRQQLTQLTATLLAKNQE